MGELRTGRVSVAIANFMRSGMGRVESPLTWRNALAPPSTTWWISGRSATTLGPSPRPSPRRSPRPRCGWRRSKERLKTGQAQAVLDALAPHSPRRSMTRKPRFGSAIATSASGSNSFTTTKPCAKTCPSARGRSRAPIATLSNSAPDAQAAGGASTTPGTCWRDVFAGPIGAGRRTGVNRSGSPRSSRATSV